jgi:HSP20 family molecular chaperone IbpA
MVDSLMAHGFIPHQYQRRAWTEDGDIAIDVCAEDAIYVIEAELPGLDPEGIEVSVLGRGVYIAANHMPSPPGRRYLLHERPVGRLERSIILPDDLDAEHVEAYYHNGLLRVVIPKAAAAPPQRIPIVSGPALRQDLPPAVEPHL